MALIDIIKKNREQLGSATQTTPGAGQTQTVQQLLSAKSGKEVGTPGLAQVSGLGAEQAAASTREMMRTQVQPELQRQQLAGETAEKAQAEQVRGQRQQLDIARRDIENRYQIQTNQILSQLEQERDQLSFDQKQARMEQASFLLAMQDKEYVRNLQEIGARNRLDDSLAFQKEMENMEFGDTKEILEKRLGIENTLAMNDREFQKRMGKLSTEDAMKIADIERMYNEEFANKNLDYVSTQAKYGAMAKAAEVQAQGLNSLVSGSTSAATSYSEGKFDNKNKTSNTDSSTTQPSTATSSTGVSPGT